MAIGLSQYNVALMHTVNHAFFKALLFLGAGINVPAINPAIFWKLLYKAIIKELKTGQSKGNLRYKILEIFRGHTQEVIIIIFFFLDFNISSSFDLYSSVLLITNKNPDKRYAPAPAAGELITINKNFSSYLAGLFEGDGCIWIPKNEKDKNNKTIYPMITLTFNSKDFPLITILQERLEIGHIYKVKGKNAYTYRISNLINLFKFINIINGYIRTPKIYQLNKLIDYLNNKGYDINKYPLDLTPLNSNAWLSGFIEADGHFSVRVSTDKKNIPLQRQMVKRIACSLEITQSQRILDLDGNNNFLVLSLIGNYLLSQVKETKSKTKNPQHRIRTTSLAGNIVLKNYLLNYPLFSSKYLDSKDWMEVLNYFEKKEHKNKYTEIIKIKSSMNDRRTFFHWNHLKNFYKLHN